MSSCICHLLRFSQDQTGSEENGPHLVTSSQIFVGRVDSPKAMRTINTKDHITRCLREKAIRKRNTATASGRPQGDTVNPPDTGIF